MSDSLKNIRIIDGDNCFAIYGDPKANKQYYRKFQGRDVSYFMPLLVLNRDEINQDSANTALQHTLNFRVPSVHRHLLNPETDKSGVIIRLFGKVVNTEKGFVLQSNDACKGLIALYNSDYDPEEKIAGLKRAWESAVDSTLKIIGNAQNQLKPDFVQQSAQLRETLSKLPEAEQLVIDRFGTEFVVYGNMKQTLNVGDTAFSRFATRSVFMQKDIVSGFESVSEECFHQLVNHVIGRKRPADEKIEAWKKQYQEGLKLLEDARIKAIPDAFYYSLWRDKGNKFNPDIWEELIVDCARYQRQSNVSGDEMKEKFGLLWDVTRHVQCDIESLAYVRGDEALRARLDSLSQARGAGSIASLLK